MDTRPPRRTRLARATGVTTVALLVLLLVGCAGGGDDDSAGSTAGGSTSTAEDPAADTDGGAAMSEEAPEATADRNAFAQSAPAAASDAAAPPTQALVRDRSVISTATVSLEADDVPAARFEVQRIVDEARGQVSDEETGSADDADRSRLVLRVPSARFDQTVAALEDVAELVSSTRTSEDVTTQVVDVDARIRAQEQSLQRVELLFSRATSIRDVVAIEAQLTRRQADLDSLKSQQAVLADQTSLATITVHLEQTPEPRDRPRPSDRDDDEAGFLPGLSDGWRALTEVGTGAATVAGAVLPFAVVLLLLGGPVALVLRRRRPARTAPTPTPTPTT